MKTRVYEKVPYSPNRCLNLTTNVKYLKLIVISKLLVDMSQKSVTSLLTTVCDVYFNLTKACYISITFFFENNVYLHYKKNHIWC